MRGLGESHDRRYLADLRVDGRIILKLVRQIDRWVLCEWMNLNPLSEISMHHFIRDCICKCFLDARVFYIIPYIRTTEDGSNGPVFQTGWVNALW